MNNTHPATRPWRLALKRWLASLLACLLMFATMAVQTGEGGITRVQPGATATLADLPPTRPGSFFKPM